MFLHDLFEYKDLRTDTQNREAFDEIYPFIEDMVKAGEKFSNAVLLAQTEFGSGVVSRLYMNIKERLQQAGVLSESEQLDEYKMEDLETMSDEELMDEFNNAIHPMLAKHLAQALHDRGYDDYDPSIQFEEVEGDDGKNDLIDQIKNTIHPLTNTEGDIIDYKFNSDRNPMNDKIDDMIYQLSSEYDIEWDQLFQNLDEGMAWAKSGNKVVRKFRCSGGPRHGRVVSKPAQCFAPPDMKKRIKLKQTKAKQGKKMARKAKKSKRTNPASKRVAAMNKR